MKQAAFMLFLIALLSAGIGYYAMRTVEAYNASIPRAEASGEAPKDPETAVVSFTPATFTPEAVDLEAVLDRALFEPGRRRPEPEAVAEPEPEAAPEPVVDAAPKPQPFDFAILGIVLQGDGGFLVLKSKSGGRPQQIAPGESIDGWTLVELSESAAVFERDGEETRLNLTLR